MDDVWALAAADLPAADLPANPVPSAGSVRPDRYRRTDQGLCLELVDREGNVALQPLTNFDARIIAELNVTDGAEAQTELEIEARVAGESRAEVIRAEDFAQMRWVIPALGPRAVVYAGPGVEDHARAAIQLLSDAVMRRTIYTHLGWVRHGDQWWFLTAGAAIGADGAVTWDAGPDGRPVAKFNQRPRIGVTGPIGPVELPETMPMTMRRAPPKPCIGSGFPFRRRARP